MQEEESETKAASRIQPLAGNEPSIPPRVAMQPLSDHDGDLLLSLRRADLRAASAPQPPAVQGRQLLFNNLQQDNLESNLAAMRQEADAAAQRLAVAEEYSANMKRRKAVEAELARTRNHNAFLMTAMTGEPQRPPINPFLQGVNTLPSALALLAAQRAGFNPLLAAPTNFGAFLPPRPPPSPPNPPHGS